MASERGRANGVGKRGPADPLGHQRFSPSKAITAQMGTAWMAVVVRSLLPVHR